MDFIKSFIEKYTNIGQLFGLTGFVIDAYNSARASVDFFQNAFTQAAAAGGTPDDLKMIAAAGRYDQVEQEGKSPDDFWAGLSPEARAELKFSPASLRASMERTSFLGMASAFLFVAGLAAGGVAAARGIPIGLKTIAKVAEARKAGASALALANLLEEGKILGIAKVWIPGLIAGIATAGGWLTSSMVNNLNDVDLWGRINLQQAEDDFNKAKAAADRLAAGSSGSSYVRQPVTRITMSKQSTPKVALGTLFSFSVDKYKVFERQVDDAITSKEDLQLDAAANLNKYLASLPGRLVCTIAIQLNPYDENGIKQSGTWAVMQIGVKSVGGRFSPLDTVLLGPVDPTIYSPSPKDTMTIQQEIPKLLTAEEIANVQFPAGDFKIVDKAGTIVPVLPTVASAKPTAPPVSSTKPVPADVTAVQQGELKPYVRFGYDALTFARLTGRWIPLAEYKTLPPNSVEERGHNMALDHNFKFSNGKTFAEAYNENKGAIKPYIEMSYPEFGIGAPAPQPSPVSSPPAPVSNPAKPPFIRYAGSPNIFDRQTGKYMTYGDAVARNAYAPGMIQDMPAVRPEVKVASDFAIWNEKNLSNFPV